MDFLTHAQAHGLLIRNLISDGRWHRCPTTDKPRSKNGAYLYDGSTGVVKNWATMDGFARYPQKGEHALQNFDAIRAARESADRLDAQRHAKAAQEAARALSESVLDHHPYLAKKGFPEALALVRDDKLLIPVRDYKSGEIMSIQSIGDDKKFLAGGKTKGGVFVLGKKYGAQRWLVEGYATGLSLKAALDAMYVNAEVWVCFSASNLQYVAERISGVRFVFADNDASGTGQRVAEATGLRWVMSPVVGEDANDFHQRAGIWQLIMLVKTATGVADLKK